MHTVLKQLFILILVISQGSAFAQSLPPIERESWFGSERVQKPASKYDNESAVILLDRRRVEYIDEGQELVAYRSLHRRIHIMDDKGIEYFNKVYLPVSSNNEIVDIMARTILPGGKIITVDSRNIRDLQEDNQSYKIFAMEGLEKGCDVEFYFTCKQNISYFGREVIQNSIPVQEAEVIVVAPERLIFEMRGYNKVNSATDTILRGKRFISIRQTDISGADEEKYSSYHSNLKRVEYKLSYNTARSRTERLFTWNELARRAYDIYATYSDKETKRAAEFVKKNGWNKLGGNEVAVISAVENYLKKNISTSEDTGDESGNDIEAVIKKRIASNRGIIRLYGAIFRQLNIDHEFVLCGSRQDFEVDRSFENWNNCDNHLIYFPRLRKYIAPTLLEMRYPFFNPEWIGTNGIFCKNTTIGNFTTAIAEIRKINGEDCHWSASNIDAKINLNKTLDTLQVAVRQSFTGYSSIFYRASFNLSPEEYQKELIKEMAKFVTNSERVLNTTIENRAMEDFTPNKPLVIDQVVHSSELVERAGTKVLVKIGALIGPQSEMYQEKPRQFEMDVNYPHVLNRTIEFRLPDGYTVKNAEDLKISKTVQADGQLTMGFESSYTVEGNLLKVTISEQYCRLTYPLPQYEDFKKVINAAADFNKVILVLEPK